MGCIKVNGRRDLLNIYEAFKQPDGLGRRLAHGQLVISTFLCGVIHQIINSRNDSFESFRRATYPKKVPYIHIPQIYFAK